MLRPPGSEQKSALVKNVNYPSVGPKITNKNILKFLKKIPLVYAVKIYADVSVLGRHSIWGVTDFSVTLWPLVKDTAPPDRHGVQTSQRFVLYTVEMSPRCDSCGEVIDTLTQQVSVMRREIKNLRYVFNTTRCKAAVTPAAHWKSFAALQSGVRLNRLIR